MWKSAVWSFTVFSFCSYVCRTRRLPGALTCSFGQQHRAVGFMFFCVVAFVDEDSIHDEIILRYGHQTTSILIRHQRTVSESRWVLRSIWFWNAFNWKVAYDSFISKHLLSNLAAFPSLRGQSCEKILICAWAHFSRILSKMASIIYLYVAFIENLIFLVRSRLDK